MGGGKLVGTVAKNASKQNDKYQKICPSKHNEI